MNQNSKFSIIVVDDHPTVRYGFKSIVEDLDFISHVGEAEDGESALRQLSNQHYDLVYMDIAMPKMNGLITTSHIKKNFPGTKVVGFSVHMEIRYVESMLREGASGYVLKYANHDIIIESIKEVMLGNVFITRDLWTDTKYKLPIKKDSRHQEDLRAILYLLCQEKSSKEIADLLCLSTRTIEKYRDQLSGITGARNIAGLIKYGIENGIHEDEILKNRFSKIFKCSRI